MTSQRPDVPTLRFYTQVVVGTCSHSSGQGSHTPVFTGRASWEHVPTTQGQWECEGESRHVLPSPHAGPPRGFEKKARGQIMVRDPSHAPRRKPDLKPDIWQRSGFLATPATLWALPFSLPFSRGKGKCPPWAPRAGGERRDILNETRAGEAGPFFLSPPQAKFPADLGTHGQRLHLVGEAGPFFFSPPSSKKSSQPGHSGSNGASLSCGWAEALEVALGCNARLPRGLPCLLTIWRKKHLKRGEWGQKSSV